MRKISYMLVLIGLFIAQGLYAQLSFEILTPLPEPVSNNAVASVELNGKWYVYSFSGIDTSKTYDGIHAKVFRYDVEADSWSQLEDLPGNQPRIAAGASTINGKIYVLGGYEVFSNGGEVSINSLHVFDPMTDSFEEDAIPIPTPIDDQVQVVYKDSLLYSITGWSNTGNVDNVWIYDVVEKNWTKGTDTPVASSFQAFGASGSIVGDTIYFIGGAMSIGGFPASNRLRKGYINPADPTDILWSAEQKEHGISYRPGANVIQGKPFWLGGSLRTYNYDGLAYSDNTGVESTQRVVFYNPFSGILTEQFFDFPAIMDMRGLVSIGTNQFISVGGMAEGQEVTDRVVKYTIDDLVDINGVELKFGFEVYPNPSNGTINIRINDNDNLSNPKISVFNSIGQEVFHKNLISETDFSLTLESGVYQIVLLSKNYSSYQSIIIN